MNTIEITDDTLILLKRAVEFTEETIDDTINAALTLFSKKRIIKPLKRNGIKPIDLEYIRECFELDPSLPSGLRWKERPYSHFNSGHHSRINESYAGKMAGSESNFYFNVNIKRKVYPCHRIVYALTHNTSDFEKLLVDHIDGDSKNNLPSNLRLATPKQNAHNSKATKRSLTGVKGVGWLAKQKKWQARIRVNGKQIDLGSYLTIEEAKDAYDNAVKLYRSEFGKIEPLITNKISNKNVQISP